jgi:hypothetical protein
MGSNHTMLIGRLQRATPLSMSIKNEKEKEQKGNNKVSHLCA